jgi:hypothetical protein
MEDDPGGRRRAMVSAIVAARRDDERVTFAARADGPAGGDRDPTRVVYGDRSLRLELDAEGRARLEDLLSDYRVFKVEQPATRKAEGDVVHLSAVTDPKHAADFVEALFREVHGVPADYGLHIEW